MRTEKLHLSDLRYNPEEEAFEALVRVFDNGEVYAYPVQMRAPLQSDFSTIARGLTDRATRAHQMPQTALRLRRIPRRAAQRTHNTPRLQDLPFMQLVLRKMAA